ncbi:MAG: hypothetical protein Q9225_002327 [Loekoesia sp. 1 TL-2023]
MSLSEAPLRKSHVVDPYSLKTHSLIINGSPSPLSSPPSRASDNSYLPQTQPSLNEETAPSNDQASVNPEANTASLIMNGFRPVAITTTPDPVPLIAGGARLTPGGPPLVASGVTYSISPSGTAVFANGSPSPFNKPVNLANALPEESAAGVNVYQPFVIGSKTLSPGAPAVVISGTTYSLPFTGATMMANGSPSLLSALAGNSKIDANPVIIAGTTLKPGFPAVTVSGTAYRLPPHGTAVIVNGSPSPLPKPADNVNHDTSAANEDPVPSLAITGQTITPGASATITSGTMNSIPASGSSVVIVNGTPSPLNVPKTASAKSALVISSQTLLPGSAITFLGKVISLPATGTDKIVVDGTIESFQQATPTRGNAGNETVFTVGKGNVTATLGNSAASAPSMDIIGESGSSGTRSGDRSGNESAANKSIENGGNGTANTGPKIESSAVEIVNSGCWMGLWISGAGVLLGFIVGF